MLVATHRSLRALHIDVQRVSSAASALSQRMIRRPNSKISRTRHHVESRPDRVAERPNLPSTSTSPPQRQSTFRRSQSLRSVATLSHPSADERTHPRELKRTFVSAASQALQHLSHTTSRSRVRVAHKSATATCLVTHTVTLLAYPHSTLTHTERHTVSTPKVPSQYPHPSPSHPKAPTRLLACTLLNRSSLITSLTHYSIYHLFYLSLSKISSTFISTNNSILTHSKKKNLKSLIY